MGDAQLVLSHEEVWRRYDEVEARLTTPLSERMLDLAALAPGQRVLDLATGRGEPALGAARRVGPGGHVLGVELSAAVLAMAQLKADQLGLQNLALRVGDVEALDDLPSGHFHAATIRWGLMYLAQPIRALQHVRRALQPGGRLVAALWAEPERVPYYSLPRELLARYRSVPAIDPEAPGTFRYADPARLERDLQQAGLAVEHSEEIELPVFEAETSAELIGWVRALGLTKLLNELPASQQSAWEQDLSEVMEARRQDGWLRLGGVTRLVVARLA